MPLKSSVGIFQALKPLQPQWPQWPQQPQQPQWPRQPHFIKKSTDYYGLIIHWFKPKGLFSFHCTYTALILFENVIPISNFIIIIIYFSIVLHAGSPRLLRISLVNFITEIFVSWFNVKFWSFFAFEGVLEFDGLDNLYWSKDTHISPPLFSYFSWTSSHSKSSEIQKQVWVHLRTMSGKIIWIIFDAHLYLILIIMKNALIWGNFQNIWQCHFWGC